MPLFGDKPKPIPYGTRLTNPTLVSLGVTPLINPNLAHSLPSPEELIYLPKNESFKKQQYFNQKTGSSSVEKDQKKKDVSELALNYCSPQSIKQKQAAGYNIINYK